MASHQISDSIETALSSDSAPTSLSSLVAELQQAARDASGSLSTESLVQGALNKLAKFEKDDKRLLSHPSDLPGLERIDSHRLLKAMLECAPSEYGRRYVASAIYHCDVTDRLVDLANTWVRYLLLPFKGNRSTGSFPPSDLATPTYDTETAYGVDPLSKTRASDMRPLVRLRDGYKCWATETYYSNHVPAGGTKAPLEVSHIIKRAVGVFDVQKTHLLRPGWDDYDWTLKPAVGNNDQVIPNTYEVEILTPGGFPDSVLQKPDGALINHRVTFEDHGVKSDVQALIPEKEKKYIKHQRPLPDAELIALHRTICHVLHLSGVGEVIDLAFKKAEADGTTVPSDKIRTADELSMLLFGLNLGLH
ncbi:hypothetical protein M422DRAFT_53084 [Sphaerobolus stellatus SS14]|uniref:HNH nuclease domain-containing protein n=1 Tax=Sphaerobolus stellatus (strain SS14) TaxID=990650 RepID=A0A0C9TPQ7_SPHS4|nr:hypothetical protein M422DRAFT_53084 [Sphaerobolus stellatus SS14]